VCARDAEIVAVQSGPDAQRFVSEADVIVNATPLGMKRGDPLPVQPEWLREGQIVSDMVYRPVETPLLAAAAAAGAIAVAGIGMLVAQGAIAMEIWNSDSSVVAPRDIMRSAVDEALATRASETAGGGE